MNTFATKSLRSPVFLPRLTRLFGLIVCVWMASSGATKLSSVIAEDALATQDKRTQLLKDILQDTTLIGHFTVDGKSTKELSEERYVIKKVEPIEDDPKLWTIESRIQYNANDLTLPLVLRIEWADKTPVIVMDRVLVPGLGTFSARVVFSDGKYAGTWGHDGDGLNIGGHLFGRIEKTTEKNDTSR